MSQQRSFLLHCNGIKLARKDGLFGKSDPFVIIKSSGRAIGFSNVVMKDLNPYWEPITLDERACGGPQGRLIVEVYDWDSDGDNDFIGSFTCTLQQLLDTRTPHDLQNPSSKKHKSQGTFVVSRVEVDDRPKPLAYSVVFKGKGLARKDGIMGKSDPFIMVFRRYGSAEDENSKKEFVAKTEYIKNDLNPQWKPMEVSVHACGGMDGPISLSIYDYDSNGGHDLIGRVETTLRQLVSSKPTLCILDPKKLDNTMYRNSGLITVANVQPTTPKYDDHIYKITVQFRAKKLDKKDTFSGSDPYLNVKRDEKFSVHKTPHVKNDCNPVWAPFDLIVSDCQGLGNALLFEVWDHDRGSISLRHLMYWEKNPVWRLKNKKKTLGVGAGYLEVVSLVPHAAPMGGMPPPGHGAPQGYGAPQHMPPPGHGAPQGYGAPQGAYGAPQGNPYGQPQGGAPYREFPNDISVNAAQGNVNPYGAPQQQQQGGYNTGYGTQQQQPPQGNYGAPQQQQGGYNTGYGTQQQQGGYNTQQQQGGYNTGYGTQQQQPPQGNYGAQQSQGNYGQPQGNMQSGYGQPQGNYNPQGQQQGGYNTGYGQPPQGNYGTQQQQPPQGYGAPQGNYGAPQGNYGAPQGNYGAPQQQQGYGAPQGGKPSYANF